jgi:hypothetical protein
MVILLLGIELLVAKLFVFFSKIKISRLKCFCFFVPPFLKERKRQKKDFLIKKFLIFLDFLVSFI